MGEDLILDLILSGLNLEPKMNEHSIPFLKFPEKALHDLKVILAHFPFPRPCRPEGF